MIPNAPPLAAPGSVEFSQQAYAFTQWMASAAPQFNDAAQQAQASADVVQNGMPTILASQNFKGNYSALTGALAAPASVFHAGQFWQLLSSLADVAAKVPGVAAEWQAFTIQTKPTINTGEVVAAGNLLAEDDAGNSQSVASITTAILQAVTATSLHACPLSNGNTAIFWTAGTTDVRMMIVDKTGATVLASTSVATSANSSSVFSCQLTDGNVALFYKSISVLHPAFKIISTTGAQVVAETIIQAAQANSTVKGCALTGGGFAVTYCGLNGYHNYAVYTNVGGVTKAWTTQYAALQSRVAICPTASGGFAAFSESRGGIFNSVGTNLHTPVHAFSSQYEVNVASKAGSIVTTGVLSILCTSDTSADAINTNTNGLSYLAIPFSDTSRAISTRLEVGHAAVLGDGTYLVTFAVNSSQSKEFPRYAMLDDFGHIVRSGILFNEETDSSPVFVVPKGANGFSLIWLSSNRNIKFANVKSGNLLGISDGQEAGKTKYNVNGAVTLASSNMLNVGGSKINYSRQGKKVIV